VVVLSGKAQSAIEFIVNYSWMLLIVIIAIVLLYLYTSSSSAIVPTMCSFENGLYCNDLIIGTNSITHVTKLIVLISNTQPYPMLNATIYSSINNVNTTPVSCEPTVASAGSAVFCVLTLPLNASFNQLISGNLYLKAEYCELPGQTSNCLEQSQINVGSFSAHAQLNSFARPLLNLTIYVPNSTILIGQNRSIFATVELDGIPIRNALLNFSANISSYSFLPAKVTTNQSGIGVSNIYGSIPGKVSVMVTYGNISVYKIVSFIPKPPPSFIYCVGGSNLLSKFNSTYYAPITNNGIGTWQQTTSYPDDVFTESCSQYNGYAYCVDGLNSSGLSNASYYASITNNGLGNWHSGISYPIKTYYQSCPIYNGKMYCIGGISNQQGSATNVAYYSNLSGNDFSKWYQSSNYLISVYGQSCVANSGYIFCMAGVFGGDNSYYAPITNNGIGQWQQTTSYPISTFGQSCVVYNSSVYCIGGSITNAVYYAPITNNGIGQWQQTTSYPISTFGQSCVVYNSSVYCIGGSITNAVYYAPITNNGIGTWHQTTSYHVSAYGLSCFA